MDPEERCQALVSVLGLAGSGRVEDVRALTGGVASDIFSFRLGEELYCAKFALDRLRVKAEWRAPLARNSAEYAWLEFAARVAPQNAVRLYGHVPALHGFVMEFVGGDAIFNWKRALLDDSRVKPGAGAVGTLLGRIHAASCKPGFDRSAFNNRNDFHALRIEPYLLHSAMHHPDLSDRLIALSNQLHQADQVLVHGDVSPKNILFRGPDPVLLDAECATMGDPAFDPAFCLNHLLLKAIHLPEKRAALFEEALCLQTAYLDAVTWEPKAALAGRILALLPALMLARVDGKSPVEYLEEPARLRVRALARAHLETPPDRLETILHAIDREGAIHG